jgi:hypothetical protein
MTAAVSIGRLRSEYHVARDHPSPQQLRERLDRIAAGLPEALGQALDPILSADDSSVWFIRRLEIDITLNAARDGLARGWTPALIRRLAEAMDGEHSDGVVRFPSRAAYLARFLADLAQGSAWGRWYYEPFSGLRALPASAALRTAICAEAATGLAALFELPRHQLRVVLQMMTESDSGRVMRELSQRGLGAEQAACQAAVRDVSASLPAFAGGESRLALALFLEACRTTPGLAGSNLMAAAVELSRELGPGSVALEDLSTPDASNDARFTPAGGAFLLIPLIARLPLEAIMRDWPAAAGDVPASTVARFLVLLKCLGGARAGSLFVDPVLRELAGIPPGMDRPALAAWEHGVSEVNLESLYWAWRKWLDEERALEGDPAPVRTNSQGQPITVQVDGKYRLWLRADAPPNSSIPGHRNPEVDDDLDYLSLVVPLGLSVPTDASLSVVAIRVLRDFARRLPGFANSSAAYLERNFLDFGATIEDEPERRVVKLGRPPLNLVLGIAGRNRDSYTLAWLDDRPFMLFEEGM